MMGINTYKLALDAMHFSGIAKMLRARCHGVGALLTLHHVRPRQESCAFAPNRILEITPEFLDDVIVELDRTGYEFISLDEFHRRMLEKDFRQRFVSLTLDDGYLDNYTHAFPIFERHRVPFAIYVCTGIMNRTAKLWWLELEQMIGRADAIVISERGTRRFIETASASQKYRAFNTIYWQLRAMPHEQQLATMQELRESNAYDGESLGVEPLMWSMLETMHQTGLLTIGAHTVNHYALSKLSNEALYDEIDTSRRTIHEQTDVVPAHFAYPYGDSGSAGEREFAAASELGFVTAVTTRKGIVVPEQSNQMHGVPRISLNGDYQDLRYLRVLMTGVPFALYQRLNKDQITCRAVS